MDKCCCSEYGAYPRTRRELLERARHAARITTTLESVSVPLPPPEGVARNYELLGDTGLHRCKRCGQHWTVGWWREPDLWVYTHCPPLPKDVSDWKSYPWPLNAVNPFHNRREVRQILRAVGREVGPLTCRTEGCDRLRVALSVLCRAHHIRQLQNLGILPETLEER
jgi:hypothetical protein